MLSQLSVNYRITHYLPPYFAKLGYEERRNEGLDKEPRKRLGCDPSYGTIAQLDRASDSGSEGRWFESV